MAKSSSSKAAQHRKDEAAKQAERTKILRIGVVQGGRIIEEKLIRARRDVSIGQAARNTFIVPSAFMPAQFNLLKVTGDTYTLKFTEGMDGRVTLGTKVRTLMQIKQMGAAKKQGEFWQIKLETSARGKLTVGDVTVLFQFVKAPAIRPKSRLPSFIRGGIFGQWDWTYGSIISGAFATHLALAILFLVVDKPKYISGGKFQRMAKVEVKRKVQELRKREAKDGSDSMGAGDQAGMEAMEGDEMKARARSRARHSGDDNPREVGDPNKPRKLDSETEDALVDGLTAAAVDSDGQKSAFKMANVLTPSQGGSGPATASGGDALASGFQNTGLDSSASKFGSADGSGGGSGGPGGSSRGDGRRMRGGGRGVGRGIRGPSRDVTNTRPRVRRRSGPRPRTHARIPTLGGGVPSSLAAKIKRAMRIKVYGLKRLYNTHLQSSKFKCCVKITFILKKSGHLSSVRVSGGCPGAFKSAVKRRVKSWKLPKGATGFQRISVCFSY